MKIKKYLKWVVSNSIELIAASALVASIFITTINAVTRYTLFLFMKCWAAHAAKKYVCTGI